MSDPETLSDEALATELANCAGRLLLELRRSTLLFGPRRADTGEAIARQFLLRTLKEWREEQPVLSRWHHNDSARLTRRVLWLINPLDGRREYAEGRKDFAVGVALAIDGEAEVGAVSLPAIDVTYSTAEDLEPQRSQGPLRIAINRTRRLAFFAEDIARSLDAELVPMGSIGASTMAVLRGEVDAYVRAIGQYEWQSAAPLAVVRHAGLHASLLNGDPLRFNQPDTFQKDLLICRRDLAPRLLSVVAETLQKSAVSSS